MLSMLPEELSDFPRSSSEKINTINQRAEGGAKKINHRNEPFHVQFAREPR